MSAPQGRAKKRAADEDDEVISMVGQRVWFVDQIEPVGTIRETIPPGGGRVVGFIIEDEKTRIARKVQRNRVRKYGDRYFLVTTWFAHADQAAKELEKQLARGLPPDRDLGYWQRFSRELGEDTLKKHLTRVAPPTYAVAGQLATAAESLSQDLARAAVTYRRVQRALVANQAVMSPQEYAQFVDEARKWSRTVRLVLMALEFLQRPLPQAHIDVRNPDAPLPSQPVYIPFEALLESHTPGGEGKARERPAPPTVEAGHDEEFTKVFGEDAQAEGEWQDAEDFEAANPGDFHPIKPLNDYDEAQAESFEPVAEGPDVEPFEAVVEEAVTFEEVAEVPLVEAETFEEVPEAPAPAPPKPAARASKPAGPPAPPPPPSPAKGAARPAQASVESLPEDEDEGSFAASRKSEGRSGQWLTPPSPPPPKASTARQVARQDKVRDPIKDKADLDAIIAASLGRTPKKSPSKASQGEIAGNEDAQKPATDALSRELASLLEKSRRK
jgi:hypothetical protein